jgi:hypothetical protein
MDKDDDLKKLRFENGDTILDLKNYLIINNDFKNDDHHDD